MDTSRSSPCDIDPGTLDDLAGAMVFNKHIFLPSFQNYNDGAELFLDILTKEEKEALLSKKMEAIRKKNDILRIRHEVSGTAIASYVWKTLRMNILR